MLKLIVALLAGLIPMAPTVIYFVYRRRTEALNATKGLVAGLKSFNVLLGLMTGREK